MSSLRKPLSITNCCKIQYLRHQVKSFLNVATATSAEYFPFFLDLEFFAHFHYETGFRSGLKNQVCKTPGLNRFTGAFSAASIPTEIHLLVITGSIISSTQSLEAA